MTKTQHSPAPWTFTPHRDAHVYGPSMFSIYTTRDNLPPIADKVPMADARRIVACVNACEGFDANDLADLTAHHTQYKLERDALRAENAKLRAALEEIERADTTNFDAINATHRGKFADIARAALTQSL